MAKTSVGTNQVSQMARPLRVKMPSRNSDQNNNNNQIRITSARPNIFRNLQGNPQMASLFLVTLGALMLLCSLQQLNSQVSANIVANSKGAPNNKLPNREIEKQIVDKILGEGYDKRIRPSGMPPNKTLGEVKEGPAVVRVNTLIRSISKIDDVTMEYSVQLSLRQEWVDERLAFARKFPTDIKSITLTEQERLWKPDLFFRNEKEGHFHKIIMPNVLIRINSDGAVLYSIRISLVLACPMDLKYYPLDKQNCTIEMASYGYLDDDLKFLWKEKSPVQINQPLTLPRFTLETFGTAFCTSRTATGAYSCLRVDLIFKREFSYYLIQIYIPCCMLVIVSWVSFWLDPNAIPARVSLGVTTLLTMATQISGINASLPPVSYTKAIDVWTGVCLTFVFGALLEFALVNYASRSDAHARMQQARQEEELRVRELEAQQRRQMAAAAAAAAAAQQQHQQLHLAQQQQYQRSQHHFVGQNYAQKFPLNRSDVVGYAGGPDQAGNGAKAAPAGQPVQLQPNGAGAGRPNGGASPTRGAGQAQNGYAATATTMTNGTTTTNSTSNSNNNNNNNNPSGLDEKQQQIQLANGLASFQLNPKQSAKQCEIHHSILHPIGGPRGGGPGGPKKNVNFCRAWLNKFPSRSKRIDVISRIFFPLMFALFNLVYWTTYLFREDDIVQS